MTAHAVYSGSKTRSTSCNRPVLTVVLIKIKRVVFRQVPLRCVTEQRGWNTSCEPQEGPTSKTANNKMLPMWTPLKSNNCFFFLLAVCVCCWCCVLLTGQHLPLLPPLILNLTKSFCCQNLNKLWLRCSPRDDEGPVWRRSGTPVACLQWWYVVFRVIGNQPIQWFRYKDIPLHCGYSWKHREGISY